MDEKVVTIVVTEKKEPTILYDPYKPYIVTNDYMMFAGMSGDVFNIVCDEELYKGIMAVIIDSMVTNLVVIPARG